MAAGHILFWNTRKKNKINEDADGFALDMASHPEGKSRGVRLVQVCANYRQGSSTSSPYRNIKEAVNFSQSQSKRSHCTAASSLSACPPEVGHLIDILKPSIEATTLAVQLFQFGCVMSLGV